MVKAKGKSKGVREWKGSRKEVSGDEAKGCRKGSKQGVKKDVKKEYIRSKRGGTEREKRAEKREKKEFLFSKGVKGK